MASSSSGDLTDAKSKRKRHRQAKIMSSNLSERLNPDFDLINAIVQKANTPKPRPQNSEASIRDVDLLVKSYPQVIHDYLLKIHKFLQSDQTELCFPNVAPFREEFLIKIAENQSLLNVVKFWHEGSVKIANEILDVLGRNKDVFKWICAYEDGRVNKNVLVYKKIYLNKSENKQAKTPSSTEPKPSTKENNTKNQQPEIPPGLKITMLNTTLKFIKDPTRKTLEYPEMTLPQAQYVHNLIQPSNKKDGDLGFGFKSMYSVLHETIEDLRDKYNFQFVFKKTNSNKPTNTKLVLSKIPKGVEVQKKQIKKKSKKLNSSLESTSSSDITNNKLNSSLSSTSSASSRLSKSESSYLSKQRIIKKLSEDVLKGLLEKFLEFIDDAAMASVEFKGVNVLESRFLESLITISRLEDYYCLFTSECEVMLKRISRAIKRKDWTLTTDIGKLSRKTETRTIVFFKSPFYDSKSENQSVAQNEQANYKADGMASAMNIPVKSVMNDGPTAEKLNNSDKKHNSDERNDGRVPSKTDVSSNSKSVGKPQTIAFLKAWSYFNSKIDDKAETPQNKSKGSNVTQKGSKVDTKNALNVTQTWLNGSKLTNATQTGSKESEVNQSGSNVNRIGINVTETWSKGPYVGEAGSKESDMTQTGSNSDMNRFEPPPASRKGRLLQALTTPLESDRAERMMRMMGWEGGALGLRGEGITEPVMPAIHITPGAGLGHVKQQPPATLSALESRISFLQSLLNFLKSSAHETKITFGQSMTKKQCSFVKHTMPAFNDRRAIGLSGDDEMGLVDNIIDRMISDLTLYIDFKISDDKKTLHLVKTEGPKFALPKNTRRKKKVKPKSSKMAVVTVNDDNTIDITKTTEDIESICPTRKAAKQLAYKIKFLEKVKEFLTKENEYAEYKYDDRVITKKLGTYFENVIRDVNKNAAPVRRFSEIENDLLKEIRKSSRGCYLSVSFDDRTFRLKKKLAKNQVNPIDSLPPPKSKDLRNTIIYHNNVVIPADKYDDNDKNNIKVNDGDDKNYINDYDGDNKNNIIDNDQQTKYDEDLINDSKKKEERDFDIDLNIEESNEEEVTKSNDTTKTNSDESNESMQVDDFDTSNDSFLDRLNSSLRLHVLEEYSLKIDSKEKPSVKDSECHTFKHDLSEVNNNNEVKDKNSNKLEIENNHVPCQSNNVANVAELKPKNFEFIKYVSIASKDNTPININLVKTVQKKISDVIQAMDDEGYLPFLTCHGIQNGELLYSCHNEYSYYWLKNIKEFFDSQINIKDAEFAVNDFKINMKINSFLDEDVSGLLKRLKLYNPEVNIKYWKVLNEVKNDKFVEYDLIVDKESFEFITDQGFSLFVGVDKAQFSILWE